MGELRDRMEADLRLRGYAEKDPRGLRELRPRICPALPAIRAYAPQRPEVDGRGSRFSGAERRR